MVGPLAALRAMALGGEAQRAEQSGDVGDGCRSQG